MQFCLLWRAIHHSIVNRTSLPASHSRFSYPAGRRRVPLTMNHTVAKLRIKATTPPGIARAKAEFALELRHTAGKDKRLLASQVKELSHEAKHYEAILVNAFLRLGQGWVAKSGDL